MGKLNYCGRRGASIDKCKFNVFRVVAHKSMALGRDRDVKVLSECALHWDRV
jgi:hypothetical protein